MNSKVKFISAVCCLAMSAALLTGCSNDSSGTAPQNTGAPAVQPVSETTAEDNVISLSNAENAALVHAGVTEAEADFIKTELDYDNGKAEYEIEFTANNYKYEYDINAVDGSILKFSKKSIGTDTTEKINIETSAAAESTKSADTSQSSAAANTQPAETAKPAVTSTATSVKSSEITADEAKAAALAHAGLTSAEVTFTKTKLDYDDGRAEYEIEFYSAADEYEYEINASTGAVIKYSKETLKIPAMKNTTGTITADEAKSAALSHAGLNASEVTFIKAKLDYDDGVSEYEIEFTSASDKYEYDINASTGAVIKYSKEALKNTLQSGSDMITADDAKDIALEYAGLTASDVRFTKAKLDNEKGKAKYEIEFSFGRKEYEFEIDAYSGDILEADIE